MAADSPGSQSEMVLGEAASSRSCSWKKGEAAQRSFLSTLNATCLGPTRTVVVVVVLGSLVVVVLGGLEGSIFLSSPRLDRYEPWTETMMNIK